MWLADVVKTLRQLEVSIGNGASVSIRTDGSQCGIVQVIWEELKLPYSVRFYLYDTYGQPTESAEYIIDKCKRAYENECRKVQEAEAKGKTKRRLRRKEKICL